jgi:hypothetical protein
MRFPNLMDIDPAATALHLNDRPVTIRGAWSWPNREMLAKVKSL